MHIRKAEITSPIVSLSGDSTSRLMPVFGIVGLACLGGAFLLSKGNLAQFLHAYLINFAFFLSIVLGALFFVMIQHLTKAGWSVTVRRVAEVLGCCIVPMAILSLPIIVPVFLGMSDLYPWVEGLGEGGSVPDWALHDERVYNLKSTFLNPMFFAARAVVYFAIWSYVAIRLYRWSIAQDESGDKQISLKSQSFCARWMVPFVLSLAFAAFDWEMSLAPMWFSTMFPVYFFAGCVMSSLATITLVCLLLQRSGRVTDEITVEHYHDLAKLTFAFIFFWGYIAFCQFMLIWYANFPEETFWYQFRSESGWLYISILLIFGHLLIPFMGMMARTVRRSKTFLLFSSIYLLAMHWVDHFWIVKPQLGATIDHDGYKRNGDLIEVANQSEYLWSVLPGMPEILLLAGMAAIFIASFCLITGNRSLVALKDPRLHEALNYDNP